MSTNLMQAHNQWATRPNDERFWGLDDLSLAMTDVWRRGAEAVAPVSKVKAVVGGDGADLCVQSRTGPVRLTHWSMGQLARYADAPAEYLRRLPAELAAKCINTGLARYAGNKETGDAGDNVQLLFHRNDDTGQDKTLRSLTSKYKRLWNREIVNALRPATDMGWIVPPARPVRHDPRARPATAADIVPGQDSFGLSVKVGDMIAPAGVYASDRDMHILLVEPTKMVDIGHSDALMRGVIIKNSEVGSSSFQVTTFYLQRICGNHILFGTSNVREIRFRHVGKVIEGMRRELPTKLRALTHADTTTERNMVTASRNHILGKSKEEVVEVIFRNHVIGLSKATIEKGYEYGEKFEHEAGSPPTSAWGLAGGLTRYSQTLPYADERGKIDASAGRILDIAVKARS